MSLNNLPVDHTLVEVASRYPVLISPPLQKRCQQSNALARQFSPSIREFETEAKELADPIGDGAHSPVKGIVHRYPNRLLLIPSVNCPSYCRFCFRKARVGQETNLSRLEIENALDYIKSQPNVEEVILSGGEPLALSNALLNYIFESLGQIKHVKVIRVHTRIQLTGDNLALEKIKGIKWTNKPLFVIVHCNHPDEIDSRFSAFVAEFKQNKATVLSQSVLLNEVNDSVLVLKKLFTTLTHQGVMPYYLHHPDLVEGAGHFRVSLEKGMALMKSLQGDLPGYAIPKYVLDLPGGFGKVPVNLDWIKPLSDSLYEIKSPFGDTIVYSDCNQ